MKAFISYPSEQEAVARYIYELCIEVGIDTFFDRENLVGGDAWNRELEVQMEQATIAFILCSPELISKTGVIQQEVRRLLELAKLKPQGMRFLVPIRVENSIIIRELEPFQYIDYNNGVFVQEFLKTVESIAVREEENEIQKKVASCRKRRHEKQTSCIRN